MQIIWTTLLHHTKGEKILIFMKRVHILSTSLVFDSEVSFAINSIKVLTCVSCYVISRHRIQLEEDYRLNS